jgi:hypothetical protein
MNTAAPHNPVEHLDEVTGLLYVEGQLEQAAARSVVAHLEHCSPCRRLLDSLKRESLLLHQALTEEDEAVPARLLAPRRSEGLSGGWLTVFALAGLGAYTLWSFYVQPWMESLQQSGFGGQFAFTWLLLNGASWKGWNDMLQFVALGSLGVLASVLLFLFRRNLRRMSSLSILLGALLLPALVHPPAAQAAEFVKQKGGYEVPEGETRHTDLFVLTSTARIDGTIEGDLFCFCHTLTVGGHVTGDVFAFSNDVVITGKVDGNLRTFNENLTVEGAVGRNILSFAGHFQNTPRADVRGSATLFVGVMKLDGPLGQSLSGIVGDGTINAPVGGDVLIHSSSDHREGSLVVTSRADIKGNFRYKGRRQPEISPQARLASAPQVEIIKEPPEYLRGTSYRYNALIWGMGFVIGLLLISLMPGLVHDTAREVGRLGVPLGLGLAAFIVLPVSAVIACITVVGIGLGVTTFFLWLFMMFFAQVFTALWVGEAILGTASGTWPMTGRLALGLLIVRLGALIPILGFWVRFVACLLGMGALAVVIYRRLRTPAAPPAAVAVSAAPAV